jgi:hypothetical protein
MATQTKSSTAKTRSSDDIVGRITKQIRDAGHSYLDSTEKAADRVADLQTRAGEATTIGWIATVADVQAGVTRDAAELYVSAGRRLVG